MKEYSELAKHVGMSGCVIVMPDEDSARSLLEYALRNGDCLAIRMDQVISFDDFWDSFFPERKKLRKADAALRYIFASDIVRNHSDKLRYFIPSDVSKDLYETFISFISGMLPSLEEAPLENEPAYKNDIVYLYGEYRNFLKRASAYETSFTGCESFVVPESSKHYIIAYADVDPILSKRLKYLVDNAESISKELVVISPEHKPVLNVYENERQEIRSMFMDISNALRGSDEIHPDEIAITVPDLATLRPYLERDAKLYDIPLSFKGGCTFRKSIAGRFITYLDKLRSSRFNTYILRDFAYDPAFPFKEREELQKYVLSAIHRGTSMILDDDTVGSLKNSRRHFFGPFDDMLKADSVSSFIKAFNRLESSMLLSEDKWSKPFAHSWGMLQKTVSHLLDMESITGGLRGCEIFTLLLSSLMDKRYEDNKQGIGVYSWPASAYMHFKRNYVISMSEDRARLIREDASFLADYEKSKVESVPDTTEEAVMLSLQNADKCIFSFSKETYEGKALPLAVFSNHKDGKYVEDLDAWQHVPGRGELPMMKDMSHGHKNASVIGQVDESEPFASFKLKDDHVFSSSQVDSYDGCPFSYALNRFFGMDKAETYEFVDGWAIETGNRIHKVEELYFKAASKAYPGEDAVAERLDQLLDAEFEKWRNRISAEDEPLSDDVPYLTPAMETYIRKTYMPSMKKFTSDYHLIFDSWEPEVTFNEKISGYDFTGRIDLIAKRDDIGVIVDWKTGRVPDNSFQFRVYSEVCEKRYAEKLEPKYVALRSGSTPDKKGRSLAALNNVCKSMIDGDWKIKVNKEKVCKYCAYGRICRGLYDDEE